MGGTTVAAIGQLSDVVSGVGCNDTGLACWSWIKVGHGSCVTCFVSGYFPCKLGKTSRWHTVWEQHLRYFQARGDFCYPSTIFTEHLVSQIKLWQHTGEEVFLCIDANQDVNQGRLATLFSSPDIQLTCLMEPALGTPVPNSHFRGTGKISTIFGRPGLVEGHVMCYPYWYSVGDHRVFMLKISASPLFGVAYPSLLLNMACRPNWQE